MIRALDIQNSLLHLVGWEQNYDTSDLSISEALTHSESGIYFQQIHPLLTLENIASIAPDFKNITFPTFSTDVPYKLGEVVEFEGTLYKALQASTAKQPNLEHEYWTTTNLFSEWLEKKTKASIQKAVSRLYNEKVAKGVAKNLVDNRTLFDGTGRITDTIKNRKNLVGFEIIPVKSRGVTVKINKIGLQFTEPGEYEIFIMHSSNDTPVYVLNFTKIRKNSIEWFTVDDIYLPYQGLHNDAGGSWYICYFQSSLPEGSVAIRKDRDWSKGPCNECSKREYDSWMLWSKYLEVHPFYVNEEFVKAVTFSEDYNDDYQKQPIHMWDIDNNMYDYSSNYGINLDITIACDFSDFIIDQKNAFADIIAKQLAIDMLREFAYNPNVRTNRHSINASRTDILYEIDGDSSSMKKSGLSYQLDLAFKAIDIDTRGIDRVCMPCKNNGIRFKTI